MHLNGPGPKIEVWRAELGSPCLARERGDIIAVVTNDPIELDLPVVSRRAVQKIADLVESHSVALSGSG